MIASYCLESEILYSLIFADRIHNFQVPIIFTYIKHNFALMQLFVHLKYTYRKFRKKVLFCYPYGYASELYLHISFKH